MACYQHAAKEALVFTHSNKRFQLFLRSKRHNNQTLKEKQK